ncbi:MAG: hypothetical protein MRY57_00740 [Candidatus Pacebacteria bacterium]|nr:hypothetical protein [Candidatus Paceibacterota bacterium]
MKKILIFLLLLLLSTISVFSQIDPQRPTFAESYSIIDQNFLQFENGLTLTESNGVEFGTFFRYSVAKRIELRSFTSWESGLPNAGIKLILLEDKEWVPGVAFVSTFDFNSEVMVSDYRISVTQNFINTPFSFTLNLGKDIDIYSIYILCYSLTEKIGLFAETQQYFGENLNHNAGATLRLTDNSQIDLHGGLIDDKFFIGAGYSFRIK